MAFCSSFGGVASARAIYRQSGIGEARNKASAPNRWLALREPARERDTRSRGVRPKPEPETRADPSLYIARARARARAIAISGGAIAMERESKKRGREEAKRGKAEAESSKKGKTTADFAGTDPEEEIVGSQSRPLGVFEFPWRDEGVVLTSEGWELRDVFFSSLVDCRAAPATIDIRDGEGSSAPPPPSDGEADGADCIWGCALSQPLRA